MQTDFASFARRMSFFLGDTNLSTMCGLQFVRFYVSSHGMRLPKRRAEALLREIVNIDHAHMDVLQIHRADNLSFDDGTNDEIIVRNTELRT